MDVTSGLALWFVRWSTKVSAGEERVVFMTTNHITKLDPALVRPGRVDVMEEIGNADAGQMKRMFQKFYPPREVRGAEENDQKASEEHASRSMAENFATAMQGVDVSMALLQGFFLKHRDDGPMGALRSTPLLRDEAEAVTALQRLMQGGAEQGSTRSPLLGGTSKIGPHHPHEEPDGLYR
jgi:hypothetical protein